MRYPRRKFKYLDTPLVIEVEKVRGDINGERIEWMRFSLDEREQAIEQVNLIDRHRNVWLRELPTDWESVINRKWDALAVYIRSL